MNCWDHWDCLFTKEEFFFEENQAICFYRKYLLYLVHFLKFPSKKQLYAAQLCIVEQH